jgi:hypothetical protein
MNENNCRIKIKYPNGFEIEIEGSKEFVLNQKKQILTETIMSQDSKKEPENRKNSIKKLIDIKNDIPYIKIRSPDIDIQSAILIILTAYKDLFNQSSINAIKLSKSIRLSGYILKRIDRTVINLIKENKIESFGTKRKRTYSITDKGLAAATIKIYNLTEKT